MKPLFASTLLSIGLGLLLIGCTSSEEATVRQTIYIGGLWGVSGTDNPIDLPGMHGADIAAWEVNKEGLLESDFWMDTADTHSDSAGASRAAFKLAATGEGVVGFVGINDSDPALGAGTMATYLGLPFVTAGATWPKLPERVGASIFLACFGDNEQAAAAAEYCFDSLKKRKVFVLTNDATTYTTALSAYFKTRWTELAGSGSIVGNMSYDPDAPNFDAAAAAIAAATPDLIFASAMTDDLVGLVTAVRKAGITIPIAGGDAYDAALLIDSLTASQSDSIYFTTHAFLNDPNDARMKAFKTAYQTRYGTEPVSAFAALGYDAVKLLANAIAIAGTTDSTAVRKALEQTTNFQGLTGTISFSSGSHIPKKSVTVLTVHERAFALAAKFIPRGIPEP